MNLSANLQELIILIPNLSKPQQVYDFFNSFKALKTVSIDFERGCTEKKIFSTLNGLLNSKSTLEKLEILSGHHEYFPDSFTDPESLLSLELFKFCLNNFKSLSKFYFSPRIIPNHFEEMLKGEKSDREREREEEKLFTFKLTSSLVKMEQLEDIIKVIKNVEKHPDELILGAIDLLNFTVDSFYKIFNDLSKLIKRTQIITKVHSGDVQTFQHIQETLENWKNIDFDIKVEFNRDVYVNDLSVINEKNMPFKQIKQLKFVYMEIYSEELNFRMFLENFCNLQSVSFCFSGIYEVFNDACSALMQTTNNLKELEFSYCSLREENRNCFENLLKNCIKLEKLKLVRTSFLSNEESFQIIENLNLTSLEIDLEFKMKFNLVNFVRNLKKIKLLAFIFLISVTEEEIDEISDLLYNFYYHKYRHTHKWEALDYKS